jgi:hypothetical protein
MIRAHHCAYFETPITGSDYPKLYSSLSSDFTFDLTITLSDTSAAYNGDVVVMKVGGGSFPSRYLDTINVSLVPGIPYVLDNVVYPSQYLTEDIIIFNEDSTTFPINVLFINSLCANEPIANSHILLKMYKFHNATGLLTASAENLFILYPNPATGFSNFKNESFFRIDDINIYNSSSVLVRNIKTNDLSENEINISGLEKGFYIIEIVSVEKKIKKKLIIE